MKNKQDYALVTAVAVGLILLNGWTQVGDCLTVDHSNCFRPVKHRTTHHRRHHVKPSIHRSKENELASSVNTSSAHYSPRSSHHSPSRPRHSRHHHKHSRSSHGSPRVLTCGIRPLMDSPQDPSSPSQVPSGFQDNGLRVGFYRGKCSNKTVDVEEIIARVVKARFAIDPTILPPVLRMQFHDCFVRGCDASILLNGTSTERTAVPNASIRGFDLMDSIKTAIESECPGIVSCADIIAVATKELLKLGGGPEYNVETGRRDGVVSEAKGPESLPSPFLPVNGTIAAFNAKGFTKQETVILLGCHTVGKAHCVFIQGRLYPGTINFDPDIDSNLRQQLMQTCPQGINSNNSAFLDQGPGSSNVVDNSYFSQILKRKGVLPIDQKLARDPSTRGLVQQLSLNATLFNIELANAMIKLQALDVLTGNQGQIRKVCSKVN